MEIISEMSAAIQIAWIHKAECCSIASVSVSVPVYVTAYVCLCVRTYIILLCPKNLLFVCHKSAKCKWEPQAVSKREREREADTERQQKTAPQWSHEQAAWKLNGVPFPCRDCHFRFLYLYKSQSKPNTCEARKATLRAHCAPTLPPLFLSPRGFLLLCGCAWVCMSFLWQAEKLKIPKNGHKL